MFATKVSPALRRLAPRGGKSAKIRSTFRYGALVTTIATAGFAVNYSMSSQAICAPATTDAFSATKMYPPIAAYETNTIKVSDLHTIYYHCYGNPKGKPVIVVHGGPGGGTNASMARYFDPKVYRVILVDQRGCGKSTPFAELRHNTTWDSIEDFEKIRVKLGIEKWQVFGGSWGSTLSLAYAMTHPDRVTELVLRGIFLLREKEIKWFYQGPGAGFMFPHEWEKYEEPIPPSERGDFLKAYHKRLTGEMGEEEMHKASKAWSIWEGRTSKLVQPPIEQTMATNGDDKYALAFARIENHYFTNKGFFPRDGWLLEEENLAKIRHIPTFIVQGRYDVVCPAVSAYELKKGLPDAEIQYTITGHSSSETDIIEQLVGATDRFKQRK